MQEESGALFILSINTDANHLQIAVLNGVLRIMEEITAV